MKDLITDIKQNSISHGSIPFWSWNDKLEEKELRRQIDRMHELGMKGFFMHARGGLETEYLSEDWYNCIRACIDEAEKLDMEAWAYDENGWPSGFAGGILLKDPKNHATWLHHEISDIYPDGDDVLGVYSISDDGIITKLDAPNGGKYHIIRQKYDESYVDTMDADIMRQFIVETYEDYKKKTGFSKHMPGFFTDEPQYFRWHTPWSNKMPMEFEKAYGYSVFSALPALFVDFKGADEFRYDYFLLCHKLFTNNCIKQIYDWCESNGCQLTGHAIEESNLRGQMWCCGGVMPFYEYEHIPGIDYLGRSLSTDLAPKQIGSVCAQLGKKKVISEMFACCGWDVTPIELKNIAELQYSGGINMMCQHLYPYSERGQRKNDHPSHYSEHLPWQESLKDFNRFFNHLGYILSLGTEYANTLVIHPIHSAYLKYKREIDEASIADLESNTTALSNLLSQNQIPYHYGDETMMARLASVEGDKIRVGLCTYDHVIIPYCYTLDSSTVALLKEYIANGGKVWIFSDAPTRIDGRIADMSWLSSNIDFDTIRNDADIKISLNGKNVDQLRLEVRRTEYGRILYIANLSSNVYTDVSVRIANCTGAYILNMDDLEKHPLRASVENNELNILLNIAASQSYVIVEGNDISMLAPTVSKPEPPHIKFNSAWKFAALPQNMMSLDFVYLSYNGIDFEPSQPLVAVRDKLLRKRYNGDIWLKFEFDIKEFPASLFTAVEPLKYKSLSINGTDISLGNDWWYDRSFRTADILPYIKQGHNDITLSLNYYQRDYVYYVLYGDVSESLRNCLNFDTEIENIYLFGNFTVDTDKQRFTYGERRSVCYDGSFSIKAQSYSIDPYDIVTDGYPFFAGTIEIENTYSYKKGDPTLLVLTGRYAVAEVSVNGKKAATLMFTDRADLSDLLTEGENTIIIKLSNSHRNLFGPHHRPDPEPYSVRPKTFTYEKEWLDGKCDSFLPRYAFVRFGIDL